MKILFKELSTWEHYEASSENTNTAARVGGVGLFTPRTLAAPSSLAPQTPAMRAPFTFGQSGFQKTSAAAPMPVQAQALPLTARADSGARPIQVTYSPTITATGNPEDFERQLSQHSQEIARMVGHEVQRQKELRS